MTSDVERANRIAERLLKENPKVAQVVADARIFDSLRTNVGWQRLFEHVSAKKSTWMEGILTRLMGPKKFWPQTEEIAYHKGFYEGAFFVLAHPEHAEKNLERAARIAWSMTYEDDQQEDA